MLQTIRTAYCEEQRVEVLDVISHGEVVSYRFEVGLDGEHAEAG